MSELLNKGVMAEAHAALKVGSAAYEAAGGKANKKAYSIGVDAAEVAVKKTRGLINQKAAKKVGSWLGKKVLKIIPFMGAGSVLCSTGNVEAAGREAFLELTGLDTPRDLAEIGAEVYDFLEYDINQTADQYKQLSPNPLDRIPTPKQY